MFLDFLNAMDKKIIIDKILNTGNALCEKGSDAGPSLRVLQSQLSQLRPADRHINFLCFFISSFIEDLYFNLSGDFPYNEKIDGLIDIIFKEIGQLLLKLATGLKSNNFMRPSEVYVDMVQVYLDGLSQIENLVRE